MGEEKTIVLTEKELREEISKATIQFCEKEMSDDTAAKDPMFGMMLIMVGVQISSIVCKKLFHEGEVENGNEN